MCKTWNKKVLAGLMRWDYCDKRRGAAPVSRAVATRKAVMRNIRQAVYGRLKRGLLALFADKSIELDRNFRPDLIDRCFEERRSAVADPLIFSRIAASYNKAKADQSKAPAVYQVNNEWEPIYNRHMGGIITVLKASDTAAMKRVYNNFMREPCSTGLHGMPCDMSRNYFSGRITRGNAALFLRDAVHRYRLWNDSVGKVCGADSLKGPLLGNTYGHFIDGTFIEAGAHYQHYYATMIGRLVRGTGHRTVLELGGGFGGMAYYLMRDNKDLTYIDFDLPENFALTAFYLLAAFPARKIALYGELDLAKDDISGYDAVLMPNFEIEKLRADSADLAFNSYSLAEMSRETINAYMGHFSRVAAKFIYHLNHTRHCLVPADEFPVDTDKFELVYRAPALWNMARNPDMDEFEYLYKNKRLQFRA